MTDKFLGTGNIGSNISNGTISIYGSKIGARNLDSSRAIKTDSQGRLQTTDLDIADVNNLQSILDNVLSNPYTPPIGQKFTVIGDIQANALYTSSIKDELGTTSIDLNTNGVVVTSDNFTFNGDAVMTTPYNGTFESESIATVYIYDESKSVRIATDSTSFDVQAPYLKFNGDNVVSTPFPSLLEATSFVKTGGTNIQYLMANGSVLTASANSGNSNFYLYSSSTSGSITPASGLITYNNAVQTNATIIYISHKTRDNIDIEVFFKQLSLSSDVYIQDQSNSENFIQYNITGTPIITVSAQVQIPVIVRSSAGTGTTNFPNGHNILLSFFTNTIEIDTRISNVESKTQNQTTVAGTTTMTGILNLPTLKTDLITDRGAGASQIYITSGLVDIVTNVLQYNGEEVLYSPYPLLIEASAFKKTGGLTTEFLKANGDSDSNTYIKSGPINNSSVPYINTTGALASSNSNLYVQAGVNTVQSALDAIISGNARSIQLSSGSFVENITLSKQNYILAGASCPLFGQTTTVLGTVTIGLVGVLTTRQKIKDIIFTNNLSFFSDATNQALRTTVSNCEFQGSITFPTSAVAGTFIYFFDCSFSNISGSNIITFPATQNYGIVFTRCNFNNQTFVNNATLAILNTFRDCTGMSSITLSPATYFGINALTTSVSNVTTTSLVLGGVNTDLLRGDGSTIATSSFLTNPYGLINGIKKFVLTAIQVKAGLQTATNVLPTVYGSKSFLANELDAGDIYRMTLVGQQSTPILATASFTANFFGYSYPFTFPTGSSGNFTIEINCFIRTLNVSTGGMVISHFSSVSNGTTTQSVTASVNGNTIGAHNFTLTYTTDSATSTLSLYTCYMVRF